MGVAKKGKGKKEGKREGGGKGRKEGRREGGRKVIAKAQVVGPLHAHLYFVLIVEHVVVSPPGICLFANHFFLGRKKL